jgi:hypothetical protein
LCEVVKKHDAMPGAGCYNFGKKSGGYGNLAECRWILPNTPVPSPMEGLRERGHQLLKISYDGDNQRLLLPENFGKKVVSMFTKMKALPYSIPNSEARVGGQLDGMTAAYNTAMRNWVAQFGIRTAKGTKPDAQINDWLTGTGHSHGLTEVGECTVPYEKDEDDVAREALIDDQIGDDKKSFKVAKEVVKGLPCAEDGVPGASEKVTDLIEKERTQPFNNPDRGLPSGGNVPGINLNMKHGKVPEFSGVKLVPVVGDSDATKKVHRVPDTKKSADNEDDKSPLLIPPPRADESGVDDSAAGADVEDGGTNTTQDPAPGSDSAGSAEESDLSDGI